MVYPDYPFIDIREELLDVFKKNYNWFGLRQPDYTKRCNCYVANDGISSPNKACSRCFGIGYVFTDYLVRGYAWLGMLGYEFPSGPGLVSTEGLNLVVQHNKTVNKFDIVLQLDQDPNGPTLRTPFRIDRQFIVQDVLALRSDDARIEFYRCRLEERNISSYRPGEEGTNIIYKGNRSI